MRPRRPHSAGTSLPLPLWGSGSGDSEGGSGAGTRNRVFDFFGVMISVWEVDERQGCDDENRIATPTYD